jgi:hypothetical protein
MLGAHVVGPRAKPARFTRDGKVRQISGNNASVASLGVLILWFCWFGFNAGSVNLVDQKPKSYCENTKYVQSDWGRILHLFDEPISPTLQVPRRMPTVRSLQRCDLPSGCKNNYKHDDRTNDCMRNCSSRRTRLEHGNLVPIYEQG